MNPALLRLSIVLVGTSGCATGALWDCHCGMRRGVWHTETGTVDSVYIWGEESFCNVILAYRGVPGEIDKKALVFVLDQGDAAAPLQADDFSHGLLDVNEIDMTFSTLRGAKGGGTVTLARHTPGGEEAPVSSEARVVRFVDLQRSRCCAHMYTRMPVLNACRVRVTHDTEAPYWENLFWVVPLTLVTVPVDLVTIPLQCWTWPYLPLLYRNLRLGSPV